MPEETKQTSNWFEAAWAEREERLYPSLFGSVGSSIFPIPAEYFSEIFRQPWDPRWLHTGVFECRPSGERAS